MTYTKRRYGGPFTKHCAAPGCVGIVRQQCWSHFVRAKYCSPECFRRVIAPRLQAARELAVAATRLPEAEGIAYKRGYTAGYATADYRWRRWLARQEAARQAPAARQAFIVTTGRRLDTRNR